MRRVSSNVGVDLPGCNIPLCRASRWPSRCRPRVPDCCGTGSGFEEGRPKPRLELGQCPEFGATIGSRHASGCSQQIPPHRLALRLQPRELLVGELGPSTAQSAARLRAKQLRQADYFPVRKLYVRRKIRTERVSDGAILNEYLTCSVSLPGGRRGSRRNRHSLFVKTITLSSARGRVEDNRSWAQPPI